ncbi:4Fe-4S ferredoxin [Slackia equolifaciens]|uniref:4Fe-4S ferredoxin n=1 Tax=Slackia equolifaciens TaxID=498718 RepID=A0A3N0B108_9ACTN|nr:4Fe-4S ferredoxin [Slackia equolifaciens]
MNNQNKSEPLTEGGPTERQAPSVSRRTMVEGAVAAAAVLALGGTVKAFAGETPQLRPPGGQDEGLLQGACIRCDRCRAVCPTHAIGVGYLKDGIINARTPCMDFRSGYCDMCGGEFLCIKACPTGALTSFDPHKDKIGVAVVDEDECQLYGVSAKCNAPCIDACEYEALYLDDNGRLVVDEEKCNGCGACEYVCPTSAYRSYDGTGRRGINIEMKGTSNG